MDYVLLPKIELHAHLTGSVSRLTLHEIWKRKKASGQTDLEDPRAVMPEGKHDYNLQTFFPLFSSYIYNLLTDEESIRYAINSVLQDFLADGVVYLELRTTPRSTTTMSAEAYITVLLGAIEEFESLHPQLHTRLILSIDRRHSIRMAESILDLAIRLQDTNKCGVVGIDLCGDPTARPGGEVAMFTPVFEQASRAGLGITVHFAEAEASGSHDELRTLLSWNPGRLGHVIWEDEEARKVIVERELCLELCLSCNVQAEMVHGGFEGHHFGHWKDVKGPKISLAILEWAFGKRMTPAERLRKNQRMLDKAIRELDQTRVKLEKQEKTLIQQIKTSAKNGQMGACKIQAKDLVRTRRYIEKFFSMRSQLQKISLRLQTYRTNEQMMQAMKGATMALGSMNKSMNLPQLQRIAMEFERENDIMEQRQEMMDDAVDDAMDVGVEEEGDEVVEQVLEEIGIDFNQSLGETPTAIGNPAIAEGKIAQAVGGGSGGDPVDDDLQARLDSLKK
ncbi:hypothetical protein H634G_00433 [Metarhizium anisopliae BRIP 53293]|uniref:Adenosine deaminase domain-containing protein n=2 Tax=Opisthokonta TaxID=33154 RepID=A0A0D9PGY3_METAN|nr:hypothetical protein H634G_00433 [Metarhizium anisopliae BRIP 53293]KJK87887.1 hypothetical protein H633G_08247 [Metarhizium anisopliae BRIP 53284]